MAATCPTCGQRCHIREALLIDKMDGIVQRGERRVTISRGHAVELLSALHRVHPGGLTLAKLVHLLWADDRDGGPEAPEDAIRVKVSHLRPMLAPLGIGIKNTWGGYRLVLHPLEEMEKAA